MAELRGNKAIENAAIAWVMELERAAGRTPQDTRYRGAPADIDSPPRLIEVKAFGRSNRGFDLWLETRQVQEARRNPDFYVYVVENVHQGDPALFTLKVTRARAPQTPSCKRQGAALLHGPLARGEIRHGARPGLMSMMP